MNAWLEGHQTAVLGSVGVLIVAGLGVVALRWQAPQPIVIEAPPATATAAPTATAGPIQVYVSGAVGQPDVVTLPADALVRDALSATGGALADADLDRINLAQPLRAGDHVHVPAIGEAPTAAPASASGGSEAPALSGPLDINTADAAQLELLPGIGPTLAERIVAYREANGPFAAPQAIQNVDGIGPSTYADIESLIVVQ